MTWMFVVMLVAGLIWLATRKPSAVDESGGAGGSVKVDEGKTPDLP